jgi:hypothetical protein
MIVPFLIEIRPAFTAMSPVGITRSRRVAFATPGNVVHRVVGSACRDFSAPGSEAHPALRQVCALGAVSPIIVEGERLRYLLRSAQEIRLCLHIGTALVQDLGDDVRVGFPHMGQPGPNGGFLDF